MLLIPNALCWSSLKCNCACALPAEVQLRLRVTRRSWQKLFAGKKFVKILMTAQTQLRSYSEQQRAFGNSNICNCFTKMSSLTVPRVKVKLVCILFHKGPTKHSYYPISSPTQQNSYSISHLLGTVTTQWLSLWRCSHCSLVPDTVTTEQWLHWTHTLSGIPYHGAYVEICLLGT